MPENHGRIGCRRRLANVLDIGLTCDLILVLLDNMGRSRTGNLQLPSGLTGQCHCLPACKETSDFLDNDSDLRCGLFHKPIGLMNFNYAVINNRLVSRGWVIMQS